MNRRKEVCRNFQRGSCQYGDRCKFLHVTQQLSKPNPFGFGSQSTVHFPNTAQQQKPNPFGFGVQNNTQLKGSSNFNARYDTPAKPFENKWTRQSFGSSTSSQQAEAHSQTSIHKCTDPESCKKRIIEDFKNEAPLWKLTCYGHRMNGPCDIFDDISFDELRAAAYEDAKRGLNIHSIVEKERNLYLSKLNEFDNLLKNPYKPKDSSFSQMSETPLSMNVASPMNAQRNSAPLFSSFSQLKAATNVGPNSWNNPSGAPSSTGFSQPSLIQNASQGFVGLGMKFGTQGVSDQQPTQPSGSFSSPTISTFNVGAMSTGSPFPLAAQTVVTNSQQPNFNVSLVTASTVNGQDACPDDSIWLKEEWKIGEIPEIPPPARFC